MRWERRSDGGRRNISVLLTMDDFWRCLALLHRLGREKNQRRMDEHTHTHTLSHNHSPIYTKHTHAITRTPLDRALKGTYVHTWQSTLRLDHQSGAPDWWSALIQQQRKRKTHHTHTIFVTNLLDLKHFQFTWQNDYSFQRHGVIFTLDRSDLK